MRKAFVYDYETLVNCFVAVFRNLQNPKEAYVFEIHPWKNDYDAIVAFLRDCVKQKHSMYSYNGLKFDNQISQFIIDPVNVRAFTGKTLGPFRDIYQMAQYTISAGNFKSDLKLKYPHWKNPFVERDILPINNYDNAARRTSLKWIQYGIDWHNIEDMPLKHDMPIKHSDIPKIIKYCNNDVLSLRAKVLMDKNEILLRDSLTTHFNTNMLSMSEPQISKTIFGLALSKAMGISIKELNQMQTYRKTVNLNEAILPYIKFKTPELQKVLTKFKSLTLDAENLKGSFAHKIRYKGVEISYALGGIHGAKRGIWKSCKDYVIMSFDVTSFYPMLAIKNRWSPAHLPKQVFLDTYEGVFHERKKYPKSNPLNYVYKIVLNAAYGLSNEKHGNFMKDPLFTMKITTNGQLLLTMLMEELVNRIPRSRPLMYNTDGGEIIIPRTHVQEFYNVCKEWEELTKLSLEYDEYDKLIIADVNNYIGVYKGKPIPREEALDLIKKAKSSNSVLPLIKKNNQGELLIYKTKEKGRFEIDKPLHKNKSFKIIRKALYNYFVHGKSPSETIDENKNIMDFCAGIKVKGNDTLNYHTLNVDLGKEEIKTLQKTNRYFVSMRGGKLVKTTEKTKTKVEAYKGYEQLLNVYDSRVPFESYPIDKRYYLSRVSSELKNFM